MSEQRPVGLAELRERLGAVRADDALVFRQLDRALARRDPVALSAAMRSLALYPAPVRERIEDAIVGWLMSGPAQRLLALHAAGPNPPLSGNPA